MKNNLIALLAIITLINPVHAALTSKHPKAAVAAMRTRSIETQPPLEEQPAMSKNLRIASLVAAPLSVLVTYLLCGSSDDFVKNGVIAAPLLASPYVLALASRLTDTRDELSKQKYQPDSPLKSIFNIAGMQIVTGFFCTLSKIANAVK